MSQHQITVDKVHGRQKAECGNPACDLQGRPKYVRSKAVEVECPYTWDGETYAVEE